MGFHQKPITFVGKVDLKVLNLARSLEFYQKVIGFQVLNQSERSADLTADGKTVLLTIEQPEDVIPKQPRTTGLYHFALLLPSRGDLGSVLRHLLELKYPLQGASDHLVSEAIYLGDPDGNGIEIYSDRPAESWEWALNEVRMTTEPMDAQGVLAEGRGIPWKGLPSETVMGHIHLHVSELSKTEEFYTKGLGLDVVTRYGGQALFVSSGKYHHHIGLNTWNGLGAPPSPKNSVGLESFTLVLPNDEEREKIVSNLKMLDATIFEENEEMVTTDPSGNRIRLSV